MHWPPRETDSPPEDTGDTVDDWRDLGDLLALATERLTLPVEGIHDAIADRWFRLAGPAAAPAQRAYRAATAGIYRSVRLAGAALGGSRRLRRSNGRQPRTFAPAGAIQRRQQYPGCGECVVGG